MLLKPVRTKKIDQWQEKLVVVLPGELPEGILLKPASLA
jgi:hypothetical protein